MHYFIVIHRNFYILNLRIQFQNIIITFNQVSNSFTSVLMSSIISCLQIFKLISKFWNTLRVEFLADDPHFLPTSAAKQESRYKTSLKKKEIRKTFKLNICD